MSPSNISRREFIQRTSLGTALALTPLSDLAAREASQPRPRWKVIAFSKPFTNLSFDDTADLVADVGWDGIECPVRESVDAHRARARATTICRRWWRP